MKAKPKYPYLHGCYVDQEFARGYRRKFLGARVRLVHYKGAMLLSVDPEERCKCHQQPVGPQAWLRGDDIDALIKMLREAKAVWLRAYRKAERAIKAREQEDQKRRR